MKTFTTSKGIELPLLNLKGKDYLQVAHRIHWFRSENPHGRIDTKCVEVTDKYVVYSAEISIPFINNLDGSFSVIKLADAVKREDFGHFADAHEKAQTGAIGRALAMCGYGTQFTEDFDEGDRIVDSPLSKPNPHAAKNNQPEPGDGVQTDEFCLPSMAMPLSYLARKPISKVTVESLKQIIEVLTAKYGKGEWPPAAEFIIEQCYAELDKRGEK